ncbi:Receptor protein kinase FERONIA [Spatholobus suberectus]|nr:Receptor protein kinase FERONIA [Spatholobus suberectus]
MRFPGITSLTLFLLLHLSIHLQAYTPEEVFTISCGTTAKSFDGERTWTGDADSNYLSRQDSIVSAEATTQPTSANQVPFTTARLSRSQFNYSFPVSAGPKFVRLFFYPASYPSFPRADAYFTVQSNQFTLLNGFNSSLNADAENTETIFKEYVVYVDDGQRLILSFTPSQPNSYAFINGIEVLSMPSDLYYPSANDVDLTLVEVARYSASEPALLWRQSIESKWEGKKSRHETTPGNLPADSGGRNITVNPDYVAPKELYRTARDMGPNATLNKIINLTWEFPVHSGFAYLLRLHFCELDPSITDVGYRVFFIYIAGQVAEVYADVMKWSHRQRGLAVHKDYAVLIPKNDTQKKVNLSLQMHPYESLMYTKYSDPFLNGLEIFKISEPASNNLAGPNPDPVQTPQNNIPVQKRGKSYSRTTIIGVAAGVASGVVLISFVVYFAALSARNKTSKWGPLSFTTTKSTNMQKSSLPSDLCRNFSLVEIEAATNNFDDVLIIGVGGFGHVYKGYIDGGFTPVAIKRLKPDSQQGAHEFMNEIEMLSQLRHLHLVSLIGYCYENNEMILVYDFMARGTLRQHLYDTDNPPLSWKQRLQICIGAARGLHYLHTGAKHMIIHRDVKTTNILLDENWVAKVSDFGLSRIGPTGMDKAHVSTVVKGSFGYLDPECYKRYRLTEKSDVYSFGVVLFEILCARPPLIRTAGMEQVSLANWARNCYKNGTMAQIVDPKLKGRIAPECFKKFCEIGVSCLLEDGTHRPSMNDVVWMLEFVLQLQESAEQSKNEKGEEISYDTFSNTVRSASAPRSRKEQVSLANWAKHCYKSETLEQIVDPTLKGSIAPECFRKFCETAMSCLLEDGTQRPSMNDIVWMLEFALQLRESAEQRKNAGIVTEEVNGRREEISVDMCSSAINVGQVSNFNNSGVNQTYSGNTVAA